MNTTLDNLYVNATINNNDLSLQNLTPFSPPYPSSYDPRIQLTKDVNGKVHILGFLATYRNLPTHLL